MKNSLLKKFVVFYCIITSLFNIDAFAEGTQTVSPTSNNLTALTVIPYRNSGSYLNCPEDNRIYFRINNHSTENFYFGFDWREYANTYNGTVPNKTNVYYRIRRPNGTVVVGPTLWNPSNNTGKINSYAQAMAGPNISGLNPAGYTPLNFDPSENGEFWIEMYSSDDGGATVSPGSSSDSSNWITSPYFDFTVATASNTVYNGRVHSDKWAFVAVNSDFEADYQASSNPSFYAYTNDQVVIRIGFQTGYKPVAYDLSVNNYGVVNGGNFAVNRRSINSNVSPSLLNGYKIFLNQPDTSIYPLASVPQLPRFISPAITGCNPDYRIRFDLPENGDVKILLNLNGIPDFQAGTSDRILEGFNLNAGYNELVWNGLDGQGNEVLNSTTIQLSIILLKGRYNLPIYDAEVNTNGITVSLVAPISVANAQMFWDDSQLTNIGNACNNGLSQSANQTGTGLNNSLIGQVSPGHAWNGDGNLSNVYPAPAINGNDTNDFLCDDFGNLRVINTWGWGSYSQEVFTNAKKGCVDIYTTISASNTEPNVGSQVTFTVTVGNLGPLNGSNVVVDAILPTGYSLQSATPTNGTYNSTTGEWTLPTLNNGQTQTLTIVANVLPNGDYDYPVSASAFEFDPVLINNNDDVRIDAIPVSDLSISKTINNNNPQVNSTVIFTITGINNGPSVATGVVLNDLLPSGYTYVSHTVPSGSYNPINGVWTIGDAIVGTPGILQITATVNPTGNYTNTATVTANELDTNTANNTSSVTPTVVPVSDVVITKTVNNPTPLVGEEVVFTITITNNGPSFEPSASVTEQLPTGYTYVSHTTTSGIYNEGLGQWDVFNLSPSSSQTLTITALVNVSGNYNNTTFVEIENLDPNLVNNSANASTTPIQNADLALTKTVDNPTPNVGDSVNFTITLTNNGPSTANSIIVSEVVPNGYTITDASVTVGQYVWGSDWSNFNLISGATATLTIEATVLATGNYLNTASITSSSVTDDNSTNNSASAGTNPVPVSDLSVTKTVNNSTPNVGDTVVFTIVAYNNGPSNGTGVQVFESLPNGYTYQSHTATNGDGTYNPISGIWNIGNFPSINNRTLTITAIINQSGNYSNTAQISGIEFDPNTSNNTSTIDTTPINRSDISITKSVNTTTPYVGSNVIFTIDVTNNGPSDASNLQIQDILTNGYTYVSAQTSNGFYDLGTGVWNIGNLANGGFATINIEAKVNASGDYSNTASAINLVNPDPNTTNNTSTVSTTPIPLVDIIVNKTVDVAEPLVGQTVVFTVTVTNAGPSVATNVSVAEALPNGYTQGTSSASTGTYNSEIWNIPSLGIGQTATLTINAIVGTSGDYCNTATAFTTELDSDTTNNASTACTNPIPYANLAITKTVDVATPNVGNIINFTITATNNGPINATNVVVNDLLPAGYNYLSSTPSVGTYSNVTGIWNIGSLNNTTSATLNIQVSVSAAGPYTNTATVTSELYDPILTDNTAVSSPLVGQIADLSIVKTVNNTTPQVGTNVIFSLNASNLGASNATGVKVQDLLPSGYTYVSHNAPVGTTYNSITGLWNIGNLNNGTNSILTITATVRNTGNYTNVANIFGNQSDNNTSNNVSTSRPNVTRAADLEVTKVVNNSTPNVGTNVIFTITATNNGQSNATGVIVTDLLPSGYQFISASTIGGGIYNNGNGKWVLNNLANTATAQLQITALVLPSGDYNNIATIDGNELDSNSTNDSDSALTTPISSADLAITNSVDIETPMVNSVVEFTLVATNNGLSNATGVVVDNILPSGYTFLSANPTNGTFNSTTGEWTIGNLANGDSEVLVISATVLASGNYTDTASITGNELDVDVSNNTDDALTNPIPVAEVSIVKTIDNLSPNVGTNVTFTLTVTNNGPSEATNVVLTDLLQSGYTFVSSDQAGYNNATGIWNIGSLANGQTVVINIVATVRPTGVYLNRSNVSLNEYDPIFSNNNSQVNPNTIPNADLVVLKTSSSMTPLVGEEITFTIVATNNGPSVATNIVVNDLLPSGYSFVEHTATQGTYNNVTGNWNIGNLTANGSSTINIKAIVRSSGNYSNTATISSNILDTNTTNNSSTVTPVPVASSDLSINKVVDILAPDVNGNVLFTITVINNGPSDATNVVVNDLLPNGYSFASSSSAAYNENTGIWTIGNMTNNQTVVLEINAIVEPSGNYTNIATVSSDVNDPNTPNNTSTASTTPSPLADVGVSKIVNNTKPLVGSQVTFTVTATNFGPSTATGTIVNDILPSGYTLLNAVPSGSTTYNAVTGVWTIGDMLNSAVETLTVTATVNISGNYNNIATIDATENDTNTSNTTSSASTSPTPVSDLQIIKTVDNASPNISNNVTFTLTATNNGISNATGVKVQDILPDGYNFQGFNSANGTYNTTTGIWTIGNLAVGQTVIATIVAQVNVSGNYENIAEIFGNELDQITANNTSSVTTDPKDIKDVVDDFGGPINGLDGATNILNVLDNDMYNNGPATLSNVILTEIVPDPNGYITLLPNGQIDLNSNTPEGFYTLTYQLCNVNFPTECETAIATIQVVGPTIIANDDDYTSTPITGLTGFDDLYNIFENDIYNSALLSSNSISVSLVDPSNTNFTINPVTGSISVNSSLPSGTYVFEYEICDNLNPTTNCDTAMVTIKIEIKKLEVTALLQGSLFGTTNGIMRDDLRTSNVIPLTEPYTVLGNAGNTRFARPDFIASETTTPAILSITGDDAIVDWVFVELRDPVDNTIVLQTRSALIQKDGDIVDSADGVSPITFNTIDKSSYYVTVKHRNHIGAMTAVALDFTTDIITFDFSTATPANVWNSEPTKEGFEQVLDDSGKFALWGGNTNADVRVKYNGPSNDRSIPFNTIINYPGNNNLYPFDFATPGYFMGDINMDAKVKYNGPLNDTRYIFFNIVTKYTLNELDLYPYNELTEQIPTN